MTNYEAIMKMTPAQFSYFLAKTFAQGEIYGELTRSDCRKDVKISDKDVSCKSLEYWADYYLNFLASNLSVCSSGETGVSVPNIKY